LNLNTAKKEQQGIKQIEGYLTLPDIKVLKNLKSYLIITEGDCLEIIKIKSL